MKAFRQWFEAALLWLAFGVFKSLSPERASALGGLIGTTIGPRLAASRKAIRNLEKAMPDNTAADNRRIVADMWKNLGRVIGEYPHLQHIIRNNVEIVGEHHLFAIGKDMPAVIISGHLANWELGPFYFNHRIDWPMAGIYRAPNNPFVERLLDACRNPERKGRYIPKSQSGVREMINVLKNRGRLGNLIDQKYNQGLAIPFLGRPAMTSPAFAQLAEKFDAPILPLRVERLVGCRFRITLYEPFRAAGAGDHAVIERCHALLEDWIRERPGQWLWLHRRWDSSALSRDKD